MPLSDQIKTLINNAWTDGYPCLLATCGPLGPNIGPKGSLFVYDDAHLAYWERTRRGMLENLGHSRKVCVMYANFKAQRDGQIEMGFLRFFGTAELYESGPMHKAIFDRLSPREQTHVGADTGIGVLIRIDRATDMRGKELL
jgi:hypothetical protein